MALGVVFSSTYGLLNPSVNTQALSRAKVINFKSLILNSLSVTADSNVTVNHTLVFYVYLWKDGYICIYLNMICHTLSLIQLLN